MWNFICDWLPVVAFISGTGLGWLINALFERVRRKHLEKLYQNSSNANKALENQLVLKSTLQADLGRTNAELEKLRQEVIALSSTPIKNSTIDIENQMLRDKIQRLKSKPYKKVKKADKNYVNEYQNFLSDLEASIKKAKKHAFVNIEKVESEKKKRKSKGDRKNIGKDKTLTSAKKLTKNKKNKSKYAFYKQKFSGKASELISQQNTSKKDLSYLFGIDDKIQDILNANEIHTFADLSNTKISELKAILSIAGEDYKHINPLNWPIQARIAEKGQWEILDEYKSRMEM